MPKGKRFIARARWIRFFIFFQTAINSCDPVVLLPGPNEISEPPPRTECAEALFTPKATRLALSDGLAQQPSNICHTLGNLFRCVRSALIAHGAIVFCQDQGAKQTRKVDSTRTRQRSIGP